MTMIKVNIHQAKARLSEYLEAVASGERVVICKRNRAVAELKSIDEPLTAPRPLGLAGALEIGPAFFEPLPEELESAFYPELGATPRSSRVAEKRDQWPSGPRSRASRNPRRPR
jgi:prevent-host-death family protein